MRARVHLQRHLLNLGFDRMQFVLQLRHLLLNREGTDTPSRPADTSRKSTDTPVERTDNPVKRTDNPVKRTDSPQKGTDNTNRLLELQLRHLLRHRRSPMLLFIAEGPRAPSC